MIYSTGQADVAILIKLDEAPVQAAQAVPGVVGAGVAILLKLDDAPVLKNTNGGAGISVGDQMSQSFLSWMMHRCHTGEAAEKGGYANSRNPY